MGNIKHRLPVLDGKTDKEKISQLSDSLFQLIRELNLDEVEAKPMEIGKVVANNVPNNTAEIGAIKTSLEEMNSKMSDLEGDLENTSALANQLKSMLNAIVPESGVKKNSYDYEWNYTKWANGELEYWRTIVYKHSSTFSTMSFCVGNDKYYPMTPSFKEIPALSVSAYALDSNVKLNVSLSGMADTLATLQTPVISVSASDGSQIQGVIITIYARGRTA